MKTNWEDKKNNIKKLKFNQLHLSYERAMNLAPENIEDREYTLVNLRNKISDAIQKLPQTSQFLKVPPGTIPNLIYNISDLMRTNKNLNFSKAFVSSTPGSIYKERIKIIEILADNEAHHEFYNFMEKQWDNWNKQKIESRLEDQDNEEPQEEEKLTRRQQILLLHTLGILTFDGIKLIKDNDSKKAILFSYLINRSEQNIRDDLGKIQRILAKRTKKTLKDIEKVNTLLSKVGLSEMML